MRGTDWHAARSAAHAAGASVRAILPPAERVGLADAAWRVLDTGLCALHPLPHYASSAMDGWVVAGGGPWILVPARAAGAGLAPGEAAEIVTGGALPAGTTAVLRREHGRPAPAPTGGDGRPGGTLLFAEHDPRPGLDIRPAATESAEGDLLLAAGTRMTPAALAVAALAGHDRLAVAPDVGVALVLTGDEVVTSGLPGPGFVRDGFGPVLPHCVRGLGGTVLSATRIGDDRGATLDAIDGTAARRAAIVVTTGGTGGSSADHLRPAAAALGAEILVDGVAMRPGHPALLGRMPDGRILLCLPGNPLAALVAVATLLEPVLRGAAGRPPSAPRRAASAAAFAPLPGRHRVVPAAWADGAGCALVPAEHIGSAMMRGLADADALLVVPPEGLEAGAPAAYLPLPW
ncbi:molybdopterin molybdotransferase MoeA [Arthrobacter halodurans]|uniref:Molybdopterin molybdenumtransferase n=1 Tax=Arthrobacter halodurans TaxID=516699 RepID=A0ABV4UP09_9MICC